MSIPRLFPRVLAVASVLLAATGLLTAAVPAAAVSGTVPTVAPAGAGHGASYYLSLGDSLSVGVQPDAGGHNQLTDDGYADQLYARLAESDRRLRLVKLGCSGETTSTLLDGGICDYGAAGSQLAAAVAFLRAHRGRVELVTIDVGANDITPCATPAGIDAACVVRVLALLSANLTRIMAGLRAVAPHVEIRAMTYYDPFLAAWLTGPSGQALAVASIGLTVVLNATLSGVYLRYGARIVDVQGAFSTTDLATQVPGPGGSAIPLAVARICAWTWMCAPAPVGPNVHANKAGYAVIADAFD
ncbi:MAG TPA: SGNH/GDSL hydrolase family protein [Mycobacteriales bacterium]|nr:SGNH/GDSL hydrolase family protein [Mycobacteriales bacterium]